jgi:tetratricopeptide (TPR) repeat protein
VINVSGFAEEVQSIINRRVSMARLNDRRVGMTEEEIKNVFRKANCPHCDAAIDLTGLPFSHYIYCNYCDTIFDSFGYEIPGGNEYRVCPESGYYDRIKHYTEYAIYLLRHERSFHVRRYMCGDAYAHLFFEKNFVKNLTLLVGAVLSLIVKIRSSINRNPNYPELVKANLHAMKGEVAEADYIYELLLNRNKHHPGLYYNLGLCYLKSGDQVKALRYFRRSLENCVNYQPTLDIIEKYRTKGQDF